MEQDVTQWEGDTELLEGHEDELASSPDLCNHTFGSKHEAFINGLMLGAAAEARRP